MIQDFHNVYLIISKKDGFYKTYVGYAKNVRKRILEHNNNKGAKSTRGRNWKLVYKKEFKSKKLALMYEYKLKKNRKLRSIIKKKYINSHG